MKNIIVDLKIFRGEKSVAMACNMQMEKAFDQIPGWLEQGLRIEIKESSRDGK